MPSHTVYEQLSSDTRLDLDEDVVHVWLLPYHRQHGREPLLALLAAYLGVAVDTLQLSENEYGRPELVEPSDALSFNWSHCNDLAVVAIARGIVPGIDLERLRERPRALEIARRYFTPGEAETLAALDDASRSAAFLRLWTAKEAVLKALGRGIAFGLHRLHFGIDATRTSLHWLDEDVAAQWQLHSLSIDTAHVATLAWRGTPRRIEMRGILAATA